ncbi:MAG TPA: CopG family transcriptional regulator [Vicinamibacteria bacterium]|nr:CopG family transcriptional regulator [Vicinamibacteria bacterium]
MKRTTITLPNDLSELVEHEARRQGISVSELIRRSVRQALMGTPSSPRTIPFAAIMDDPEMVHGDQVEQELSKSWADELDRRR